MVNISENDRNFIGLNVL